MSKVYITIGFPGSGKSTWSKEFAKSNKEVVIINRDSFRTMIKGDVYTFDFRYEPFIKQSTNRAIETALEYGLDIIVDETHIKAERRKEIINTIRNYEKQYGLITKDYGETEIIYMWFTENKRNLEFRMKESRGYDSKKWEEVINGMINNFEPPTENEGCNKIIKINPFDSKTDLEKKMIDLNNDFKNALKFVLLFEGGYVNHPNDPGGETNKGIIKKVYDEYRNFKKLPIQSVKLIEEKEIEDIYFNNYWKYGKCDLMPRKIAMIHFDTCVNCGVFQANKFLQRSLKVLDDGFIGPKTLKTLRVIKDSVGIKEIISEYLNQRRNFYKQISDKNEKLKVFLKGWNNRLTKLEIIINNMEETL
jgi:lysozyme family protein/tRNA uridine 5-carbamoylmethylation protein Kti12